MQPGPQSLLVLLITPPETETDPAWLETGLSRCGYQPVITRADYADISAQLISRPCDAVFLDSTLAAAEMRNAIDTVRWMRPDLPVILITHMVNGKTGELQALSADGTVPSGEIETLAQSANRWLLPVRTQANDFDPQLAERRRIRQLEILYQVSQEIARASSSAEAVYTAIHRATARLMSSEAFVISLIDEDAGDVEAVYLIDRGERFERMHMPFGRGVSGTVIETRAPLLDLNHGDEDDPNGVYFGSGDSVRSVLAVPLWIGDRIIGVISAQSYMPNAYGLEDQRLLEMLSSHAAIALENNRLFDQSLRQALTFENMFDAVYMAGRDGIILDWNPAAERMFGYARSEAIGQHIAQIYHIVDEPMESTIGYILETLRSCETVRTEVRLIGRDGREIDCEVVVVPLTDNSGQLAAVIAVHHDITARKKSETALLKNEELLRVVLDALPVGVHVVDDKGQEMLANRAAREIWDDCLPLPTPDAISSRAPQESALARAISAHQITHNEIIQAPLCDGTEKSLLYSAVPVFDRQGAAVAGVAVTQDISAIRQRESEREAVINVSNALRKAVHSQEIYTAVLGELCRLLKTDTAAILLSDPYDDHLVFEQTRGLWDNLAGERLIRPDGLSFAIFHTGDPVINLDPNHSHSKYPVEQPLVRTGHLLSGLPLVAQEQPIGVIWLARLYPLKEDEMHVATAVADIAANAIQRSRLFEQSIRHAGQMAATSELGKTLSETLDAQQIYERLAHSIETILPGMAAVYISLFNKNEHTITAAYCLQDGQPVDPSTLQSWPLAPDGKGMQSQVIRSRQPLITNRLPESLHRYQVVGTPEPMTRSALTVPLQAKGELLGTLQVQSYQANRFGSEEQEILSLVGNTAAIAMVNARLFAETRQRMQHLAALRAIDVAIRSGAESRVIFNVLLDQLMLQLKIDAASVLLFDPLSKTFNHAANRGFRSPAITRSQVRMGEGLAGRIAFEQRSAHHTNLPALSSQFTRAGLLSSEGFRTYTGTPLVAKGQVKGILEVFSRRDFTPDDDWVEFFETLAGDLAIALDNITLFDELQRSNDELTLAYDTTLEGWARALELRDQETEGHSKRVTAITLHLAQRMKVRDEDLVHIRRGALLHDIGKMAISDSILRKNGPLDAEEWEIMRRHPSIAYELLAPIGYLKPSLAIPLSHHERWDGTGYPQGLHGKQIPLPARIFAVVDVWDALTSDRPYRPAWTRDAALDYIKREAGLHFDPLVVENFLELLSRGQV